MEHATLHPCTQAKLVDFGFWFWQKPIESMAAWLLCLWDVGVDGIMVPRLEKGKLASQVTPPALGQRLQKACPAPGTTPFWTD